MPQVEPRSDDPLVILIAPNVSEQMGGEAIKSWQIYQALERRGVPVHQITHARCRDELRRRMPEMRVSFVEDDWLQVLLWRTKVFRSGIGLIFQSRAARLARRLIAEQPGAVVHINQPVSPVEPMFHPGGDAPVIIGPVNGNIYYPPGFRDREPLSWSIRRRLHPIVQGINRVLFRGRQRADVLLVAGGDRTAESLRMAGCRDDRMRRSLDSGIPDRLRDLPRIEHRGANHRFVHNGRLMPHKGADLILKALTRTKTPASLDLIGRGQDEPRLRRLAEDLRLGDRVRFLPWFEDHSQVAEALRAYRGFVLPSLAEANGIVVQEAMMLGLPSICLDWGGPATADRRADRHPRRPDRRAKRRRRPGRRHGPPRQRRRTGRTAVDRRPGEGDPRGVSLVRTDPGLDRPLPRTRRAARRPSGPRRRPLIARRARSIPSPNPLGSTGFTVGRRSFSLFL